MIIHHNGGVALEMHQSSEERAKSPDQISLPVAWVKAQIPSLTINSLGEHFKKRVIRLKVDRRWHDACISYETEIDAAEFEMVSATHYH